jgi:hypothetical protein
MLPLNNDVRRCLEECDIAGIRRLWQHVAPGVPQPETDFLALATIHRARTQAESIRLKLRAWSHRWLLDHNLPSALPDKLRPKAERMYPIVVSGVGISVNARSEMMQPVALAVRQAMSDAVMEAYADHQTEPTFVKARMMEARIKILKS